MKLGVTARQAVIGGLVILGMMAVVGVGSVRDLVDTAERLTRWNAALARLDDTMSAFHDARNSLQVYFKTDADDSLHEFRAYSAGGQLWLNELRAVVDNEPQLRASLETLVSATGQLDDWRQQQIEVHQNLGEQERVRLFSEEPADSPAQRVVKASEEFQRLVGNRQRQEARLLQSRSWWTIGVILGGSASAAGVALFAAWSVRRELSQRQRTESQLLEREARLQTILNSEPECVKLLAADGTLLEMNAAGLAMIEADRGVQVVGKCVYPLVAAEYRPDFQKLIEQVFQGEVGSLEFEVIGLKGTRRWLETHATPLRGPDGRIASLLSITRDITDRKRNEESLRTSERKFASVFYNSPVPTALTTLAEGRILDANDAYCLLLGYSHEELIGHTTLELNLVDPQIRTDHVELLRQGRTIRNVETRYRHRSGQIRDVLISAEQFDLAGEQVILGISQDITDRKRTEAALRASEERFRSFMDHLPAEAFIKDSTGRYIFGNKHWAENYPLPLESVLGKTDFELWPDRVAEMFQASDREVLREGHAVEVQQTIEQTPGMPTWFQVLKFPIQQDSAPPLVGGIALDVTRNKQIEESLRQTAQRLNTLLATSQAVSSSLNLDNLLNDLLLRVREAISGAELCAIYIYDPHTKLLSPRACIADATNAYTYMNLRLKAGESVSGKVFQSARSLLLRTPEEVRSFRGVLSPENEQLIAQSHLGNSIQSTLCAPLITSNGKVIGTISLASTRLPFTNDDLSLLEGIAAQTTVAIRNAELFDEVRAGRERLQSLSRQLIAAQETERRHIARELHDEIGQMLTAVGLKLHSLKGVCDEVAHAELEAGLSLIDHAVEQVRDMSLNLRPSMLDVLGLDAAIRWCLEQHRERAGWKAHLDVQLESRLPSPLETTCFRLVQAALTNVARHARATEVWVNVLQRDMDLELIVRDNGVGFDHHRVRQRSEQGDSFGISAMRERVELAGGRFHIDSALTAGTSIQAYFPLDLVAETVR